MPCPKGAIAWRQRKLTSTRAMHIILYLSAETGGPFKDCNQRPCSVKVPIWLHQRLGTPGAQNTQAIGTCSVLQEWSPQ